MKSSGAGKLPPLPPASSGASNHKPEGGGIPSKTVMQGTEHLVSPAAQKAGGDHPGPRSQSPKKAATPQLAVLSMPAEPKATPVQASQAPSPAVREHQPLSAAANDSLARAETRRSTAGHTRSAEVAEFFNGMKAVFDTLRSQPQRTGTRATPTTGLLSDVPGVQGKRLKAFGSMTAGQPVRLVQAKPTGVSTNVFGGQITARPSATGPVAVLWSGASNAARSLFSEPTTANGQLPDTVLAALGNHGAVFANIVGDGGDALIARLAPKSAQQLLSAASRDNVYALPAAQDSLRTRTEELRASLQPRLVQVLAARRATEDSAGS